MKTQFFSRFRPREIDTLFASMARYTRFVFFSKLFLVALAASLTATVLYMALLQNGSENLRVNIAAGEKTQRETPTMTNPQFQGVDDNNQPYNITARSAIQVDADTMVLDHPTADIMLNGTKWFALSADNATLRMKSRMLELVDNVYAFYGEGYEMRVQKVAVDINAKTARSDTAVEGRGPLGTLNAAGFMVTDSGGKIQFAGPVQVVLRRGK